MIIFVNIEYIMESVSVLDIFFCFCKIVKMQIRGFHLTVMMSQLHSMYRIHLGNVSVRGLAMSLANVSTTRLVLGAPRLDTRTIHALRNINVLTVEKSMHHITKMHFFINESMIFSILEYHRMYIFSKLVQFIKKTHGQRVMNYVGPPRLPPSAHQYVYTLMCRVGWSCLLH